MKFTFLLITLALCLTACDHHKASLSFSSGAEVQEKLAGTWREEKGDSYSIWVVASNGDYAAHAVHKDADGIRNITEEGTWIVKDGVLIETCTKSNQTNAPHYLPLIRRFIIVRLDDRELATKSEERPEFEAVYRKEIK